MDIACKACFQMKWRLRIFKNTISKNGRTFHCFVCWAFKANLLKHRFVPKHAPLPWLAIFQFIDCLLPFSAFATKNWQKTHTHTPRMCLVSTKRMLPWVQFSSQQRSGVVFVEGLVVGTFGCLSVWDRTAYGDVSMEPGVFDTCFVLKWGCMVNIRWNMLM